MTKKPSPSASIFIPKDLETRTTERMMKIIDVNRQVVQIDARWLNIVGWRNSQAPGSRGLTSGGGGGFLSRLTGTLSAVSLNVAGKFDHGDLTGSNTATIFLHITTADLRSSVDPSFKKEIERATKKFPPSNTKIGLLTALLDHSSPATGDSIDLFGTVLPKKSGNLFIGFPTSQTTGLLAHVSAPSLIPTVERENIDLNPGCIGKWNRELLRAAGILCRIAWACEMDVIKRKLSSSLRKTSYTKQDIAAVLPEATQLCHTFSFQESAPSSSVAKLLHEAFWTSYESSIELLSSQGVLPSHQVRFATEDLSSFVQGLPVVPEELVAQAKQFVDFLKALGYLTEITVSDVKKELDNKALNDKQLRGFLEWSGRKIKENSISAEELRAMMSVAVASLNGKPVVLKDIKYYINPARIPAGLPHPPDTVPFNCTKGLPKGIPEALGWTELQIAPWLEYLIERSGGSGGLPKSEDITGSPAFSVQVLTVLYKNWDHLSQSSKETVVSLLQDRTVMPTKMGMKKPAEAYLPTVKLFDDLPVVSGLTMVKDKFLVAIGVRNTPDVDVIIDRMFAQVEASDGKTHDSTGKWNHVDIIRYLASMANDIPSRDIERLRSKAIFPAEDEQDRSKPTAARYKITELFEPKDHLRKLRLPILQWSGLYRFRGPEGHFLTRLGLKAHPFALDLINIMAKAPANGDMALYEEALTYFIVNHHNNGYAKNINLDSIPPYLPLEGHGPGKLAAPADCFLNERSKVLGFDILKKDLHIHAAKFGVREHPSIAACVNRLLKAPPQTKGEARSKFGYFGSRLIEISPKTLQQLSSVPFVPICKEKESTTSNGREPAQLIRYTSPQSCFLEHSSVFSDFFDFVDFGPEANAFLEACGSKRSPSPEELATLFVREPARLFDKLQSDGESQPHQKYERLLRNLASHLLTLKQDKALFKELKTARYLLAYKIAKQPAQSTNGSLPGSHGNLSKVDYADGETKKWLLASAAEIVLVKDDSLNYGLFKYQLLTAPEKDDLEEFYHALGSPYLNSIVEEDPRIGPLERDQSRAVDLQELVFERSPVFLHRLSTTDIKHDARWLQKNLKIEAVKSISLRLTVRNYNLSRVDERTAATRYDEQRGWILYITQNYNWEDVCLALVKLLMIRPNGDHAMALGNILSLDLNSLRRWGVNVDRILRQKEEAQMAENERQRQLDEERKRIQEKQKAEEEQKARREEQARKPQEAGPPEQASIPGGFAESSADEESEESPKQPKQFKGFFESIKKRLGLDGTGEMDKQSQSLMSNEASSNEPDGDVSQPPGNSTGPQTKGPSTPTPGRVGDASDVENIRKVINACRPYDSPELYAKPETRVVNETSTYCDSSPKEHITFVTKSSSGIKIFLAKNLRDKSSFVRLHTSALNTFASILLDLARMFELRPEVLHIFHDEHSTSIAFNNGSGSLFCNFQHFLPYWEGVQRQQQQLQRGQKPDVNYKGQVANAWFITLCHELAHNAVGDHSAQHEFYL